MNKSMKWFLAVGVTAVMGAHGIGVVSADQADQNSPNPKPQALADRGDRKEGGKEFKEEKAQLLQFLKIDEAALQADMKAGKTLAAIANEQGISEQDLTDFLVGRMTQHIDDGVKAGRFNAEQAEKMKANTPKMVTDMINGKMPMHGRMSGHPAFANPKLLELLKLDSTTFQTEIKAGKTLAVIAGEHGVSEQALKDFLVNEMTQRIDADVNAGRITAERAEKMKAAMESHVSDMINGKMPMRGHGPMDRHPEAEQGEQ